MSPWADVRYCRHLRPDHYPCFRSSCRSAAPTCGMSADTRACQADKSREQTQMRTSAIGKAATKATAIVKANAPSKFTSWAHVVCRNAACSTARSQNAVCYFLPNGQRVCDCPRPIIPLGCLVVLGINSCNRQSSLWVALALLALTVIAYVATPSLRRTTVAARPIVDSKADK